MGFRFLLVAIFIACGAWVDLACALRVLIVEPEREDPLLFEAFGRLRAELEIQGFEVAALSINQPTLDIKQLEAEARLRSAFAAIALAREGDGTTGSVHIVDRVTGKIVSRTLKISVDEDGPTLLAIRAADLLRISLNELSPGQTPPADVVGAQFGPAPREVVRFSHPPTRFQIGVGLLSLVHADLGPAFGAQIVAQYRLRSRLSLGIELGGPVLGGRYRTDIGSATIRQEYLMALIGWNLGEHETGPHWEWGPVLGAGAAHLAARGDVRVPLENQDGDKWALGLLAAGRLEAFLSRVLSFRLQAGALGLLPQPVIAIDESQSRALTVQFAGSGGVGVSF